MRAKRQYTRRVSGVVAAALAVAACALMASPAAAAVRSFRTGLQENIVTAGEPFTYTLIIETEGEPPDSLPTVPDWGGLTVVRGPSQSQRMTVINGRTRVELFVQYSLVGTRPGKYVIGSSRLLADGQVLDSGEEPITVEAPDLSVLPESVRDKPILHPIAENPEITRQLRGRAFVLAEISRSDPYVGEPFSVTFYLYQERLPPAQGLKIAEPTSESMLAEEPYLAQSITPTEIVTLDDRDYDVALLYRGIYTPTRPGVFQIEGFRIEFYLPVQGSRPRPRSGLDAFFDGDPIFTQMVAVQAGAPPLEVTVRPVPEQGRPPEYSGTVGNFRLTTDVDRKVATQDDLFTLTATISGEGNAALATPPGFPESDDFEVFDQTEATVKQSAGGVLSGTKTIEYLLRPKRAGTLRIPGLRYPIFNPKAGAFELLRSDPAPVQVSASRSRPPTAIGAPAAEAPPEIERQLDYIQPLLTLRRDSPEPLYHSPLFWGVQVAALMLAAAGLVRSRRRESIDPAAERRRNSWTALEFKLRALGQASGPRAAEDAALALERALREFIADWFNLKAEGLTAPEISFRLMAEGMPKESIRRIEDIMEGCARVRYAPTGESAADFTAWSQEAKNLLREVMKR